MKGNPNSREDLDKLLNVRYLVLIRKSRINYLK